MRIHILLLFAIGLYGCMPSVSTTLDTAVNLSPGQVSLGATGSLNYGIYTAPGQEVDWGIRNTNFGGVLNIGFSDKLNGRARYEYYHLDERVEDFVGPILPANTAMHYGELGLKWGGRFPTANLFLAGYLPVGVYHHERLTVLAASPAFLVTNRMSSNKVEFTSSLKGHLLFGDARIRPDFALGLSAGFSSNLDRWALRPEIATNFTNVSFGVGLVHAWRFKR